MHHLIEISYINLLLNSSETSTRQMHKRNWDESWESVQEEKEGMRLGNMRIWRVWNSSFPMHNSWGINSWESMHNERILVKIGESLLFCIKMVRNHSWSSLSKMLSSSGFLDFYDAEWWDANSRQKFATQNKKPSRACSSYISDIYQYIIRNFMLSAQAGSISLSGVWFRYCI